ncbi:MAG: PAS domain-containing protein [Actinomycetota bacterium]
MSVSAAHTSKNSDLFAEIVDTIPVPLFLKGPDSRYLMVNTAFEEFTGRSKAALIDQPLESLYPPEEAAVFHRADTELLAARGSQHYETTITSRHGPRDVLVHKSTITYGPDRTIGIVGVFIDLSSQKRAESELAYERNLLEQVIETMPASMFWLDTDLRVEGCNTRFAGVEVDQLHTVIGKPVAEAGRWTIDNVTQSEFRRVMASRTPAIEELTDVQDRSTGNLRVLEAHRIPLIDEQGEVSGLLGVALDITERRRLESQLANASKLESIGQMAAGVAHEINTPTQFVSDNVTFLSEGVRDLMDLVAAGRALAEAAEATPAMAEAAADYRRAVEQADLDFLVAEMPAALRQSLEGVERISHIVRAMKDMAHPGRDLPEAVDLNRAIDSTTIVAANEWKYVADLDLRLDPDLPPVVCRSSKVNQVLLNLIVNASHAIAAVVDGSGDRGTITVESRLDGGMAEVAITDTGCGIPDDVRERVFDPFFTTKEVGKGTGQGLALAYNVIVVDHGGELTFDTELGCGTTFRLRIPADGSGITD